MFRHGRRILAVIAAVVLVVGIHASRAADFAGSVQGVVKSASGQALAGAYVKLINPERRLTFMVISQAQGRYSMNNLPPGNYTVQGIGNGFESKLTPLTLTSDKPATADVSLTEEQGPVVPNGWIRRPGRVAGNELDFELQPPNLPEGEGKAIVEAKCGQCHFLHRLTQMRWTRPNWEKKIAWMRERIHERQGAQDLTDQEEKTVIDYLAKNFSNTTPKPDPNGRLSRTLLQGAAAKYIAVDYAVANSDAALHDITVDPQGIAWVNELNEYKLGRFDPKTYEFTDIDPPPGPRKIGVLNHMGPPVRGVGELDLDGGDRRQPSLAAVRHQVPGVHRLSGAGGLQGPDDRQQHARRPERQDGVVDGRHADRRVEPRNQAVHRVRHSSLGRDQAEPRRLRH